MTTPNVPHRVEFSIEVEGSPSRCGTVTGWDPPRRLVDEEAEWMTLVGQPSDAVATPLATEFLVEARSGIGDGAELAVEAIGLVKVFGDLSGQVRSGRPSTPSAKRHSVPRRDSVT